MVLVVDKKFLEDDWWKYGLALFGTHLLFWCLLVYKLQGEFTLSAFWISRWVLGMFLAAAVLPFVAGRLQLRKLFWFGFVGYLLALAAYYALSLMKVGIMVFTLLPFIAFLQVFVTCFGLGALVEFGRYVLDKLAE